MFDNMYVTNLKEYLPSSFHWRQTPPVVPVVDHLAGHAAVDADVLAGDEAGLVVPEIQHHAGDIHRVPHPTRWLLHSVGTLIDGVLGVDPARGDGVDAHLPRQTDRQRVGQRGDASLGGSVLSSW